MRNRQDDGNPLTATSSLLSTGQVKQNQGVLSEAVIVCGLHRLYMPGWESVRHWCHSTTSRCRQPLRLKGGGAGWGDTRCWPAPAGFMYSIYSTNICKLSLPVRRKLPVHLGWHDDFWNCVSFLWHQSNSGGLWGRQGFLCWASFGKHWLIWLLRLHHEVGTPFWRTGEGGFLNQQKVVKWRTVRTCWAPERVTLFWMSPLLLVSFLYLLESHAGIGSCIELLIFLYCSHVYQAPHVFPYVD